MIRVPSIVKYFFVLICGSVSAQQFSKAEVLYDMDYLISSLEDTHINLYAYSSKKDLKENYQRLRQGIIEDSLSQKKVALIFQKITASANNAHTRIAYEDQLKAYISYFQSGGTLFPLELVIEDGKALIRKNWSTEQTLKIGTELTAINGIPINEVLEKIYPLISAENLYFKNAILAGLTFPRFYWQVFGEIKTFEVKVKENGGYSTKTLEAIKAFDDYENKRYDILRFSRNMKYLTKSTAYLRPGQFGGDLDEYKQFIDSSFSDVNKSKVEHLIIDLRNHPGGDDPYGDYLVSYFADQPFRWASKFQLKSSDLLKQHVLRNSDTSSIYAKSILGHKDGEIYDYDFGLSQPQPKNKRFKGKVYVLVNRMSYSQSTVTAAQIQDYGWGQIVGEETGEFPNLYASIFSYQLPKTGMTVEVSKGKIQRVNGIDNGRGVIPDIIIKDHLLDDKDEIVDTLLSIIQSTHKTN